MLRSDVTEAQMSDCLIAAGKQIFVVRKRPLFDARASFEGDDVAGIGGKRLAIVGLVSLLNFPLKVRCCTLHGLLHLSLGHFAFRFPRPVVAHLLSADVSTLRDGDLERDAGLALNPFDVCHSSLAPFFFHSSFSNSRNYDTKANNKSPFFYSRQTLARNIGSISLLLYHHRKGRE